MKKKGSALLVVVIIMSIVFTMAVMMISSTLKSNRQVRKDYYDIQSYYCAEAGINDTIETISDLFEKNQEIVDAKIEQQPLFKNDNASYKVTKEVISSNISSNTGGSTEPSKGKGKGKGKGNAYGQGNGNGNSSGLGPGKGHGKGHAYGWYKKHKNSPNTKDYDIIIQITSEGHYFDSASTVFVEIELIAQNGSSDYEVITTYKEVTKLD